MADQGISPKLEILKNLEAALLDHRSSAEARRRAREPVIANRRFAFERAFRWAGGWRPWQLRRFVARKSVIAIAGVLGVALLSCALLWLRLASGPISLDVATPWLTAAIEENFGGRRRVEVGGTQLERDEHGRTALRIRDVVVRDADGTVVASAPGAEVGFSGTSLLSGRVRAERLSLVGAQLAIRIEADGQLTIFAGADKRPFAITPAVAEMAGPPMPPSASTAAAPTRSSLEHLVGALAWIDGLGAAGLDGYELDEIGVKNGNVTVDDKRTGKEWKFEKINLSLTRSRSGELTFNMGSEAHDNPWQLAAAVKRGTGNNRMVSLDARKVPLGDVMLATRMADGQLDASVPVSITLRADIGQDGAPQRASGRMIVEAGAIGPTGRPEAQVAVERAEFSLDWDAARGVVAVPFQIVAGGNRFTLFAQAEAPREAGGAWTLGLTGGTVMLGPLTPADEALVVNRVVLRGRLDPAKRRIDIEQGDLSSKELGIAFSGGIDYSTSDPRIAIGGAARNMTATTLKQFWPPFVNPKLRSWIIDHYLAGTVERVEIATNAPLSHLRPGGPPLADDGISVQVITNGSVIMPIDGLPPIRDAELVTSIKGRSARVEVARGTVELPSGRKLAVANGLFEVPDTQVHPPPSRTRFRIEGPVPAAAELVAMDRLRDAADAPLDPAQTRGTVSAQVTVGLPITADLQKGAVTYTIAADLVNFAADRFIMGQKVEGSNLKVAANAQGYTFKGDVKIGATPASIEYRKTAGESEPEVRLQATLDEAARTRFGFDLYGALKGPVPIKLAGRMASGERDSRYAVEADLTQAKIDNLLPGWQKPAGKAARAVFALLAKPRATRFEDILVEGAGTLVKGTIEVDPNGDLVSANFPVFALSDGDKAMLRADRGTDSTLRVTMRGDVYDGRSFVKSQMSGPMPEQRQRQAIPDLDLDIKLGAVAGFHGEALRGVDLRLSRRAGEIRSLNVNARIGVDTPLLGDLRARTGGRQVMYFETADAGALFRFTDTYARMAGGKMWVAMDPPGANPVPQDGVLNIRDFAIRGEPALDRIVSGAVSTPNAPKNGVDFSRMHVDFIRTPGKLVIREGVVRGPVVGATIDGNIDYGRDEVRLRGTFVPLYGINNMFGQIPIVGLILGGGSNEGVIGITYEVTGSPGAPVLRVNPISVFAPGMFRKILEFPNADRGIPEANTRELR